MAYMNQEKKAVIKNKLQPILKKYKMKGSLSVRNHSTIVLHLSQGPIDFIGDMDEERHNRSGYDRLDKDALRQSYTLDVNPYWYHEHYTGKSRKFLTEVFDAMKSADWYDNSDASMDYFDTAYYVDVNIGKWRKPYTLTK